MSKSELKIVEFPYDDKVWRFSSTYSIQQDGKFWMQKCGSRRRAWSTRESAENAILNWRLARIILSRMLTSKTNRSDGKITNS